MQWETLLTTTTTTVPLESDPISLLYADKHKCEINPETLRTTNDHKTRGPEGTESLT